MDANLLNFLISFSSGLGANLTTSAITAIYQKAFGQRPDLENRLTKPSSPEDFKSTLAELAGVIEALAGSGSISVDGSLISALRSVQFDHQNGKMRIGNSVVVAPFLQIGGSGPRWTYRHNRRYRITGGGAGISIGEGAGIVITGGAGIKIS